MRRLSSNLRSVHSWVGRLDTFDTRAPNIMVHRPRPRNLFFTPKYRDISIRRSYVKSPIVEKDTYKHRLMAEQMNTLGFTKPFLRLHFIIQYGFQALVQFAIVVWSFVRYAIQGIKHDDGGLWESVVAIIDVAITILLVTDLLAHLADNASVYWRDWYVKFEHHMVHCIILVVAGGTG